jgi:hypothetical protein
MCSSFIRSLTLVGGSDHHEILGADMVETGADPREFVQVQAGGAPFGVNEPSSVAIIEDGLVAILGLCPELGLPTLGITWLS